MSGARWLVCEMGGVKRMAWDEGDEWCMMAGDEWRGLSGERWVVGDEWWEMSVYVTCCMRWVRWVVWDVRVCDMLCERWMRWVVWDGGERWAMWDEWIKMSGVRWVVWEWLPRTTFTHSKAPNAHARTTSTQNFPTSYWHSYPQQRLHTASCQTRMPGRHQRKIFAPPIGAVTPNDVYTQQAAKPARQEDTDAKFSRLLLAQLPRTQFTHSKLPNPHAKLPNPHARKTSP